MIGIFGGTFDPVHYGHLRSALEAKEIFGLEEIRLIPSAHPPHRTSPRASATMRLEMLYLAVENMSGFVVDTREIDRAGQSYMVITLESLRRDFPDRPLLLFIGTDAFNALNTWYQWQRLFDLAHVIVLTRPGYRIEDMDAFFTARQAKNKAEMARCSAGKLFFQVITQLDISATAIRSMIARGNSPRFLLPDAVIGYISEYRLYK